MTEAPRVLRLRKHANKESGRKPDGSYPLLGVTFEDGAPEVMILSTHKVAEGVREKWIVGENPQPVVRPAGASPDILESTFNEAPHVFIHYDALVFRMLDGEYRYRVTHQPDKYADHGAATFPDKVQKFDADDDTKVTEEIYLAGATRVDHFYRLELEG